MGRPEMSLAEYQQMLRLADSLIAEKRWGKAIGCLTKMLCRRLRDVPVAVRRMKLYAEIGEYGAALADAGNILKWCPGEPQALRTRGILRLLARNYEMAVPDLQAALKRDPQDRDLLAAWAEAKSKQAEAVHGTAAAAAEEEEGRNMGATWWHCGAPPAEPATPTPARALGSALVIAMDPAAWPAGVTANLQVKFDRPDALKLGAEPKGPADSVGGPAADAGQ
jgi:tetratricopeptide (TPR) repeat protein